MERQLTNKEKLYILNYINSGHHASNMLEDLNDDDILVNLWDELEEKSIDLIQNFQNEINNIVKQKLIL